MNPRLSPSRLRPFRDPTLALLVAGLASSVVILASPRFVGGQLVGAEGVASEYLGSLIAILVFPLAWFAVRGRQVRISMRFIFPTAAAVALTMFVAAYTREEDGFHPGAFAMVGFSLVLGCLILLRFQASQTGKNVTVAGKNSA